MAWLTSTLPAPMGLGGRRSAVFDPEAQDPKGAHDRPYGRVGRAGIKKQKARGSDRPGPFLFSNAGYTDRIKVISVGSSAATITQEKGNATGFH